MSRHSRRITAAAALLVCMFALGSAVAADKKTAEKKGAKPAAGAAAAASVPEPAPAVPAPAPEVPAPPPPPEPPADAGLFGRVKSFFGGDADKGKDAAKAAPADDKPGAELSLGARIGGNVGVVKVKDIDTVYANSAAEFDPTCSSLVEPFGVTDNLLSLAKLSAKLALKNFADRMGAGGTPIDLRSTLKLAGKNLNWLPADAERMLGERMHADLLALLLDGGNPKERKAMERATVLMRTLLAQVKEETPYKFRIDVRKSSGNAQALPGGFLLIDRDLMDAANEDKAYFALAHELAHVLQRHETRATQARLTDSIDSLDGLRKLIDTTTRTPASIMAYSNQIMTRFVTFSKDQEMQADSCAVRLLDAAFTDKKRLGRIIRSYQASMGPALPDSAASNELGMFIDNVQKMDKIGDQHPNSAARSANLDKMLGEVGKPVKTAQAGAAAAGAR
jgi:Zn-dependent protease with chaperone function